jgi:hypothetical protein
VWRFSNSLHECSAGAAELQKVQSNSKNLHGWESPLKTLSPRRYEAMALRDLSLRPPVEPLDCTPATAGQELASRGEYRPCRKDFS